MLQDVAALFDDPTIVAATDRRLTGRLVDAWVRASRSHFPSWSAMQEIPLGDDWGWIFAIDLKKSIGFPYFIYLGECLAKFSDVHLCGGNDWTMSLLDKATHDIAAATSARAPHYRDDKLTLCDGRCILMRSVTAPLADDGENITHVIGAANGRFAPALSG